MIVPWVILCLATVATGKQLRNAGRFYITEI